LLTAAAQSSEKTVKVSSRPEHATAEMPVATSQDSCMWCTMSVSKAQFSASSFV